MRILTKFSKVQIIACGTSYHAGMIAKYWFEQLIGVPCQVEIASEFRYRTPGDCGKYTVYLYFSVWKLRIRWRITRNTKRASSFKTSTLVP